MDCQNADTPILADGLMSLMPLSIPTASNEADWREVRMWLREMAGMGLHRIESIMDGMTLILPTKLKSKISARAKSIIETAACTHSRIQDVQVSLLSNPIQRAQVIRPGDTGEDLCEGVIYMEKSSNSTLAPFEHMMHRQTNIRFSFKVAKRWNGNWSKSAKCGVKERIGNNGRN